MRAAIERRARRLSVEFSSSSEPERLKKTESAGG